MASGTIMKNNKKSLRATATANQTFSTQLTYLKPFFNSLTTSEKQEAYLIMGYSRFYINDILGAFYCETISGQSAPIRLLLNLYDATYRAQVGAANYTDSSSQVNTTTIELYA